MRHRAAIAFILVVSLFSGLAPSVPASAAGQSPGPYVGLWTDGTAGQTAQLDQLGVGWARAIARWERIQPAPDTLDFADLDAQVNAASGGGKRRVLVMVRNNPAWAAASRCKIAGDAERTNLANFLTVLVNRYKDRVKYWQLYNEMDNTDEAFDRLAGLGGCFGTANGTTPTQTGRDNYALTLERVADAIHAADPQAKVVSGAVVSGSYLGSCAISRGEVCPFDIDFLKGVLARLRADNRLDALDHVAVHYFSSQAVFWNAFGPDLLGRINKLRQDMRDAGLSEEQLKPILADEGSFTNLISGSTADPSNPFNIGQRDYLVKALARAAFADLVAYFWFWTQDVTRVPDPNVLGGDNSYGLLTVDGDQKPSYRALQYFQSLVDRQDRFLKRLTVPNSKLEGYEFGTSSGRRLQILWNEADLEVIPYVSPFGASATVTDPVGAPIALANQAIQVGASPVFILSSPECSARSNVATISLGGADRLQVTVTATSSGSVPNNHLTRLHFDAASNLLIDVPGGPTNSQGNFDVNLPPGTTQTTFTIHRANPAIPTGIVSYTVADECGTWPLFAGGGPAAWAAVGQAGSAGAVPLAPPSPAPVDCSPRPAIAVASKADDPGRLRVTVASSGPGNHLQELRFAGAANATLDIGNQTGDNPPLSVPLPAGTRETSFVVRRVVGKHAATVSLVVVDGCGEWPTLVGGGPDAF